MKKQEWKDKLQNTRNNRIGIGIYTLDSFDDEVAEILSEHDAEIRAKVIDEFAEALKSDEFQKYNEYDERK